MVAHQAPGRSSSRELQPFYRHSPPASQRRSSLHAFRYMSRSGRTDPVLQWRALRVGIVAFLSCVCVTVLATEAAAPGALVQDDVGTVAYGAEHGP